MKRKLKRLGGSLVSVVVLAAIAASAATAAEFHAESSPLTISGSQLTPNEDTLTFKTGTVSCASSTYHGTTPYTTSLYLTLYPAFGKEECTAFGFAKSSIDVPAGCQMEFTSTGTNLLHHSCPAGQSITITAPNCWVKLIPQTLEGVTFTSEGSGKNRDIRLSTNISGVFYTQENKSFPFCTGGAGKFGDGKMSGDTTLIGTTPLGLPAGLWYE